LVLLRTKDKWKTRDTVNILFIAYNVNIHSRTGDAVHVRELVSNMAAMGNKVSLVVGFNANLKEDISFLEKNPNVSIHYIENPRSKYPRHKDILILSLCMNLAKRDHPDIIYERNFSCRIGTVLSKILKIPLILEINGVLNEEAEMLGRSIPIIRRIISDKLKELYYSQADKIIVVSLRIKKELIDKYNVQYEKIHVVPNGANINLFKPMDQKTVQGNLGMPHEFKYICFVGNLVPWQGVEYLINSAPLILNKNPYIKFLIVGDGIMKENWEKMVKEKNLLNNFLFIGSVPFEKVPLYINASDVCVATFTNDRKCSPIKVFEYLSCGKPVILSNIGDDSKLFNETDFVVLIDLDDPNELADKLSEIISNNYFKLNIINAREFILMNYTWRSTAEKVLKICSQEISKANERSQ
jgi:glycosyltransferase involved in cell wall biosynthesis